MLTNYMEGQTNTTWIMDIPNYVKLHIIYLESKNNHIHIVYISLYIMLFRFKITNK